VLACREYKDANEVAELLYFVRYFVGVEVDGRIILKWIFKIKLLHLMLLDFITVVIFGEEQKQESIMQLSPPSCYFLPLRSKYSSTHTVLKSLCVHPLG
jgi:hypothetical protein